MYLYLKCFSKAFISIANQLLYEHEAVETIKMFRLMKTDLNFINTRVRPVRIGVSRFTVGAVRVRSRWAGQAGGVVAVVVAGVAGRAGLSLACCRQRHGSCDVLHADFWLHPTIQHLCL